LINSLFQETLGGRDDHHTSGKRKECPLDKDELGTVFNFLGIRNALLYTELVYFFALLVTSFQKRKK
jgi:hypothetical protein